MYLVRKMGFLSIVAVFVFLLRAVSAAPRPGRIVGGTDTSTSKHLYQVSIQSKIGETWRHMCGGSVIDDQWIITASHCVDDPSSGDAREMLRVVVHKDVKNLVYHLEQVVMHPDYAFSIADIKGLPNDIALLKTTKPIADADVYRIGLPPSDDTFIGENCTITGWGYVEYENYHGTTTEVLQETWGNVLDEQSCQGFWPGLYNHTHHICIRNDGSATCLGDSGGPLVCKQYLAGVTTIGNTLCALNEPEVYTRVSNYVDWINDTMAAWSLNNNV